MYPITHSPIHSSIERSHGQSTSVLRDSDVLIAFTNCHTLLDLLKTILLCIWHDNTLYRQISHTITKTGNDIQKLYDIVSLSHISP